MLLDQLEVTGTASEGLRLCSLDVLTDGSLSASTCCSENMTGREVFGSERTTRHLHECSPFRNFCLHKDDDHRVHLGTDVHANDVVIG